MRPARTLDSLHHKEWHRMGKRMAVGQAAEPGISQPKAESRA